MINIPDTRLLLVRELEAVPDLWSLGEWADWLTPTDLHEKGNRRFDTMFYLASLQEVPVTVRDELEVTASQWTDPASCLQQYYDRQLWLAPPQARRDIPSYSLKMSKSVHSLFFHSTYPVGI